jgi:hypothetical protein
MRYAVACLFLLSSSLSAAEPLRVYDAGFREEPSPYAHLNLSPAQLQAAQELEQAQFRFISWMNFEMPQRLRKLEADLALAQQQLASLQRIQAEENHFNVWSGGGNPFFTQAEQTKLLIVSLQQQINLLQAERSQALQFQGVEYRQRQMEVERARLNLRLAK